MEIILTGTGSPLPDAERAGPSTLVKAGDTQILVDAGRGTVMRLTGAGTFPIFLSGVLITHLHSDHLCALNDIITTHWVMGQGNMPLNIWGPPGIQQFVDRSLDALEPDIGYRIAHHEVLTRGPNVVVTEVGPGETFDINDVSITTAATMHAPVHPTVGYRLTHDGSVAALAGDTIPCDGLDTLCTDADAYVQTVIRADIVEQTDIPMMLDILDYHSSVVDAAQTAARNGVKKLVLTHLVPAPQPADYPAWIAQAQEHFEGEVIIGPDLTSVTI